MKAARAAAVLLWLASPAFAGAGKDGFSFLSMTSTPRASAMGDAGGALADEAGSSLDNPAALGVLRAGEAQAAYASLPESLAYGALSYARPFSVGAAAAHVHVLEYGDITGYDGAGLRSGAFSARDTLFAAGWGRPVGRSWSVGVNGKQVGQSIAGRSATVLAADLGALYRPTGALSLSFGLRNLGGKATFVGEGTALPRTLHAGGALRLFSEAWVLAAEARRPTDGDLSFHAGQEVWLHNVLAVRAGWRSDRDLGSGLTVGFGVRLQAARIDYSFSPMGDAFGQAHRVGLSFRFGGAGEKAYQEGVSLAQQGHHAEAIMKFKATLDADPGHRGAVRGLRESVTSLQKERGGK